MKKIHFGKWVVWCSVNRMNFHFSYTSILPSISFSNHSFLQIILALNGQCGKELNQFHPPNQQRRPLPSLRCDFFLFYAEEKYKMYLIQKESCGIRLLVRKIKTLEYHILLVTNVNRNTKACLQDKATKIRVGHRVLLRSEGFVLLCSF